MPYLYSAMVQANHSGTPVLRPLLYDYQNDLYTHTINDQFLFGDHFLVAPVYTPSCNQRSVYLPQGYWYDYHSGEEHSGEQVITAQCPIDRIPIFVKAGSVIPMWPEAPASTQGYFPEKIQLHIYAPRSEGTSHACLEEDDGISFQRNDGHYLRTTFALDKAKDSLTLKAETSGNGFPEFRRTHFEIHLHGMDKKAINLPNHGKAFSLEL